MFEWLADPVWGGIGTIFAIGVIVIPLFFRNRKKGSQVFPQHDTAPAPIEQNEVHGLVQRFVAIYKAHGVERTQIPRFLGEDFGLTLTDVSTDEKLLHVLNENVITKTCEIFGVRREWLDGAEPQVHLAHDFYKQPEIFFVFIKNLLKNNAYGGIVGILLAPNERDWQAHALLILQETVGFVGDKPIYRYYLCNNWAFTYWKARAYLAACIAIAWKHEVFVYGVYVPKKEIERLAGGTVLLGWQGEGIWQLGHKTWSPEDMALLPEAFLKGIAPEKDKFGIKSGLKLWLDLEQQGLMDTGIEASARQKFQQELAKY